MESKCRSNKQPEKKEGKGAGEHTTEEGGREREGGEREGEVDRDTEKMDLITRKAGKLRHRGRERVEENVQRAS